MKILIIGAGGFLGQLVSARLADDGHELVCQVRNHAAAATRTNARYVQATLDDNQALAEHASAADYIFHFAWDTTPGTSKGQPVVEAVNNLLPTFRFLEQLHSTAACPLAFVSTGGAIYEGPSGSKATESSSINPKSYYGAGKVAVEMFLRAYAAQSSHSVTLIRPSNLYGPGQIVKRQFAIVPTLMQSIRDRTTFRIWGNGEVKRDYLYAEDFGEFCARLVRQDRQGIRTYNVASECSYSINQLCDVLQEVSGGPLRREYVKERGVDVHGVDFDCSRAKLELGWTATTELREGLAKTWEWFLKSQ